MVNDRRWQTRPAGILFPAPIITKPRTPENENLPILRNTNALSTYDILPTSMNRFDNV